MNVVTFPRALLRRAIREGSRAGRPVSCPVGRAHPVGGAEWIVRGVGGRDGLGLVVVDGADALGRVADGPDLAGALAIGRGAARGEASGFVVVGGRREPVDRLAIVGPGMESIPLGPDGAIGDGPGAGEADRWSRTAGALGADAWRRLAGLRYVLVGLGRTGSLLAEGMAIGWGARRLTLVDPDVVEPHNLGEMAVVGRADVGRPKVEAVALGLLGRGAASARVEPVAAWASDRRAMEAVRDSDAVFSGVDHDSARAATAALAALFCRPHLDVATGVHGEGPDRRMGADVRLALPGERCLLCLGGLADPDAARSALASTGAEEAARLNRDWRRERAGSLRSLNALAASIALRLWEDLVAGRVGEGRWVHLEIDQVGRIAIADRPTPPAPSCPLCRLMGTGEAGLARAGALIRGPTAGP